MVKIICLPQRGWVTQDDVAGELRNECHLTAEMHTGDKVHFNCDKWMIKKFEY
jgi:hypothetical protein